MSQENVETVWRAYEHRRDGKQTRMEMSADPADALKAAGLEN